MQYPVLTEKILRGYKDSSEFKIDTFVTITCMMFKLNEIFTSTFEYLPNTPEHGYGIYLSTLLYP